MLESAQHQILKEQREQIQRLLQIAEDQKQQIENILGIADDNLELAQSWKKLHLDTQSFLRKEVLLELRTSLRAHVLCFIFVVGFLFVCLYARLWASAASQALLLFITIKDILDNRSRATKMRHLLDNPQGEQT